VKRHELFAYYWVWGSVSVRGIPSDRMQSLSVKDYILCFLSNILSTEPKVQDK
jgi:hypothetical protein